MTNRDNSPGRRRPTYPSEATMLLPFGLAGCDQLAGLTDPDVADALVVGVDVPEGLDLSGTDWSEGASVAAWLGTIGEAQGEAVLRAHSDTNGLVPLAEKGDGAWSSEAELAYVVGETWVIERDGSGILRAEAAPPADVSIPSTRQAGAPLRVDAGGQDFDVLVGTVLDLETGEEVWTDVPSDGGAFADLLLSATDLAFEIPGDVFERPGPYAVGVGGLRTSSPAGLTDVNTVASRMATGVVRFQAVTVQ